MLQVEILVAPRLVARVIAGVVRVARRLEEADVVRGVVRHEHAPVEELQQGGQHLLDARRLRHHRLGDAGEDGDERRQGDPGIHQRLQRPQLLAHAIAGRPHLGDLAGGGRPPGGLQVEDAEGDLRQGHPQVVEAGLEGDGHPPGPYIEHMFDATMTRSMGTCPRMVPGTLASGHDLREVVLPLPLDEVMDHVAGVPADGEQRV